MPVKFTADRWDRLRETYRLWWGGELDRPIIPVHLYGADPGRPEPAAPLLSQATCADFTFTPEALIDRIDYELSRQHYLGDAFPFFNMDCFGPGVVAAFLGGRVDNSTGQVWFFPDQKQPIQEIQFRYDADNIWLQRVKEIYQAGMARWQGQVLMGMTDLGGNLDILATFRPGEGLLYDLYDHPEEVKRLTWEAHNAWHQYFTELSEVLQPINPGYSDWSGLYRDEPGYILQSDLSYMISPQMFVEFVKPELAASIDRLSRAFYHLDGVGQLNHLDELLAIERLAGVQWVPGDGKPDCAHWPEVFQKIRDAGKLVQIFNGGFQAIEAVCRQTGSCAGLQHLLMPFPMEEEAAVRAQLDQYGIE